MREMESVGAAAGPTAAVVIPVLLYHSVSDAPPEHIAPYAVSPGVFARHLDLIASDHQALTVSELVASLDGTRPLPTNPVVITFDDGFADNLEVAAGLLAARSLAATVYVTTGYVGRPGMLSWRGVEGLETAGLEVGAHAQTHIPLDELHPRDATDEILGSKEALEDRLGHEVASFAYPHGYSDNRVRRSVEAAGFRSACGVRNALSHGADDRWNIARLTVQADMPLDRLERWMRSEGAPVAARGEAVRTRVWRAARRMRRMAW